MFIAENLSYADLPEEIEYVQVDDIRSGLVSVKKFDFPISTLDREDFTVEDDGRISYAGEAYVGIDVSEHQGEIDWAKVKADGIEYAIIRLGFRGATSGDIYLDSNFVQNLNGAIENDIKVGVYFFSQAMSLEEANEEASFVLENIKNHQDDIAYPIVFDWEQTEFEDRRTEHANGDDVALFAKEFCDKITQAGYEANVYLNKSFGYNFYDLDVINEYPLWIAEYEFAPSFYYYYTMWQYSDSGVVDGISVPVDMNLSFKNYG